jgi:hypothetical protein
MGGETVASTRSAEAMLTALALLHAYQDERYEDLAVLSTADEALPGVLAVAGRLMDEIEHLGGDPGALLARIYDRATVAA